MRLKKLHMLTAVVLLASGSLAGSAGATTATLTGAGSSLAAPLVVEWAQAFQVFYGTQINFQEVGSQELANDVSSGTAQFGVSDAPVAKSQGGSCTGCLQIPWALTAIGIGYHVNGIGSRLHLDGSVLADIYLGQITSWNNSAIRALNPGLALPALHITPIYAKDSDDTYAFTDYLSKVSGPWRTKVGAGATVSFPGGLAAGGSSAVAALLESTNGTIAYAGASYLIARRLPAAAIENSAGAYEYPNLDNIADAARTVTHVPADDSIPIVDPSSSARTAYPISTFVYVIVPAHPAQRATLARWILYAIGAGQSFGPGLDFAAIPSIVAKAGKATVDAALGG